MSNFSVGDMAQQFVSRRNGSSIKSEFAALSNSMSSGKVSDLTRELGGETARFSGLQYSLSQLDTYQQSAQETLQVLESEQLVLQNLDTIRNTTAQQLLLVNESSTRAQLDQAAEASRSTFDTVVRLLNTQVADRSLFGGARVNQPPLAPADDMIASLGAAVGTTMDASSIVAIVDDWFESPTGGFAVVGYLGDTGPSRQRKVNDTTTVAFTARADNAATIELLKGAAIAALAEENPTLDQQAKVTLLEEAGKRLFGAATPLTEMQAQVGYTEKQVQDAMAGNSAQITGLSILQNNLERADPFETATRLQAVQLQLETHFAVTARMSQLSLLRYI